MFAAKQFIAGVFALAQANCTNFVDLPYEGGWVLQKPNGKNTRIADVVILGVQTVFEEGADKPSAIWVTYSTKYAEFNRIYHAVIPANELARRKILQYFQPIRKKPGCTDGLLQDLIYWLLQQYPSMGIHIIPPRSGWSILNNKLEFLADQSIIPQLAEYYTESTLHRQLPQLRKLPSDIVSDTENLISADWRIRFLLTYRAWALLLPIIPALTDAARIMLVIENSDNTNIDCLKAMLTMERYDTLQAYDAECPPTTVRRILSSTNDAIALFHDTSCVISATDIKSLQKTMAELVKGINGISNGFLKTLHLTSVISNRVAAIVDPSVMFRLDVSNLTFPLGSTSIQKLMEQFDALLIKHWLDITADVWMEIEGEIESVTDCEHEDICSEYQQLVTGITITFRIVRKLLGIKLWNQDSFNILVKHCKEPLDTFDTAEAICKEFSVVLSRKIRKNELLLVKKDDTMRFSDDDPNHYAILFNENICIPVNSFNDIIMPRMKTASTVRTLLSALRERDFLYATKHNFLPLDVFTSGGHYQSLKTIAVSVRLLEADIREKVDGLGTEGFRQDPMQMPRCFLPLIQGQKKVSGRIIIRASEENNHIWVTGQSGMGKSFALSQIAASFAEIGHKVLIFDTSGSFTSDALHRNLPSDHVDRYVQFHRIEDSKIPVDLFNVTEFKTQIQKRNAISGILCASELVLGPQQENILKQTLDSIVIADSTTLNPVRLVHELQKIESNSAVTLLSRLEPVLEEIKQFKMSADTWADFLKQTRPITVISLDSVFTSSGYKLIDMLIASLYNHKIRNPESQITIILDELQNQNLQPESSIAKIMREGRKLGIAMVGATQIYRPSGEKVGNVMRLADTKLFLKPTLDSEDYVAKALRWGKKQAAYFDRMERGDCIVSGPLYDHFCNRNIQVVLRGQVYKFEPIPEWRKQH